MSKKPSQPSKAPERQRHVVWRPRVERDPQFNPFLNVVDDLSGAPLVNGLTIPGASERF